VAQNELVRGLDVLREVSGCVKSCVEKIVSSVGLIEEESALLPGKMLRPRFGARLVEGALEAERAETLVRLFAAVEIAHTASLCHDDVIDKAGLRRGAPSFWRSAGVSGAILVGDLLLCDAMRMVLDSAGGRYVESFVSKISEICAAEAEQEITLRGEPLDERTCLRLARSKTGPFFAFVGLVSSGDDGDLSLALEEAGYRVGAAYQLADDLLDADGDEKEIGKTLGTDRGRGKFTLARFSREAVLDDICGLCRGALECVKEWPEVRGRVSGYLSSDLGEVFERHAPLAGLCRELKKG